MGSRCPVLQQARAGRSRAWQQGPCLASPPRPRPLMLGAEAAPGVCPVFLAACSQHPLGLFTRSSERGAAAPCSYRPREDSTSLRFKHAWRQARGENCWAIAKRPGGKPQPFHSCLLACTTSAPGSRAARKTRRVGAALHRHGLLWQRGENAHERGAELLCMRVLGPMVSDKMSAALSSSCSLARTAHTCAQVSA